VGTVLDTVRVRAPTYPGKKFPSHLRQWHHTVLHLGYVALQGLTLFCLIQNMDVLSGITITIGTEMIDVVIMTMIDMVTTIVIDVIVTMTITGVIEMMTTTENDVGTDDRDPIAEDDTMTIGRPVAAEKKILMIMSTSAESEVAAEAAAKTRAVGARRAKDVIGVAQQVLCRLASY
jgi:membrane glycosyltransferase